MRTIEIIDQNIEVIKDGVEFILLGDEKVVFAPDIMPVSISDKVVSQIPGPVQGLWGTLGMANDSLINWTGRLEISKNGNDDSRGQTLSEIIQINNGRSNEYTLGEKSDKIIEKFLAFNEVTFPNLKDKFKLEELPMLRLTLMVEPDEGALVFYVYTDENGNEDIEYILPNPTNISNEVGERDRLDYFFPALHRGRIVETKKKGIYTLDKKANVKKDFVVKALTFKRDNKEIDFRLKGTETYILDTEHAIVKYEGSSKEFIPLKDGEKLDGSLKTLFLIHGTASTTNKGFNGLRKSDPNGLSWIDKTMSECGYKQVIGFDHPTFNEDARDNAMALKQHIQAKVLGQFENVDIITHSRGGLFGKFLLNQTDVNSQEFLKVNNACLVACANGVGYFTRGHQIAKLLSILRKYGMSQGNVLLTVISALAQFSAEAFLNLPGAQLMTPGNDRLIEILEGTPQDNVSVALFAGDFEKTLVENDGLLKRWGALGLDLIINGFLGSKHDWVVGTKEQLIGEPFKVIKYNYVSRHSEYFYKEKVPACQKDMKGALYAKLLS